MVLSKKIERPMFFNRITRRERISTQGTTMREKSKNIKEKNPWNWFDLPNQFVVPRTSRFRYFHSPMYTCVRNRFQGSEEALALAKWNERYPCGGTCTGYHTVRLDGAALSEPNLLPGINLAKTHSLSLFLGGTGSLSIPMVLLVTLSVAV